MKRFNKLTGLLVLSLVGTLSGCDTGNVVPDDSSTVALKTVLSDFNSVTSYDLTADIPFAISTTYKEGISTTTYARDYAIEYSEATGGNILTTVGYANYVSGDVSNVMRYSYDDNGDIEAGYIIDKNTTISASSKVSIGIKKIDIPTSLKEVDDKGKTVTSYEISPELTRDRTFLESIVSKAIYGLTYSTLKKLGTIDTSVIEADCDGKGFTVTIKYQEDEDTIANGGKITVRASNFNSGSTLAIKDFLDDGGEPKAISNEAKKLNEYAYMNSYSRNEKYGYNIINNVDHGYVAIIYDEETDENKNCAFIPVYGVDGLATNFYVAYIAEDGSIDLDLNDLTTFNDRNAFKEEYASQYFTNLTYMYYYMIHGWCGLPYLASLSTITSEDDLYVLGDYTQLDEDGEYYGFISTESAMVTDMTNYFRWDSSATASYGTLIGGLLDVKIESDDEDSTVAIYALTYDSSTGEESTIGYGSYYTGFGSDKAKVDSVDKFVETLYPSSSQE